MRIVILATEPSGDFLGSKLIKNLKKNKKVRNFRCWWRTNESGGFSIVGSN